MMDVMVSNKTFDDDNIDVDLKEQHAQMMYQTKMKVDAIIQRRQPWEDPEFPPSNKSLGNVSVQKQV